MLKKLILLTVFASFSLSSSLVDATTLTDTLVKRFKKIGYNKEDVDARITIQTEIPQIEGDRTEDTVLLAYKVQVKAADVFKKSGWRADDPLLTEVIEAGMIEFEMDKAMGLKRKETILLKAFVYQCDMPMHKYRGGDLDEYFQRQVLEKAEECFTYDEKLQGKNYPY